MNDNNDRLKTLLGYSIPSIISMILSTTLTLTDGYFVGNYVGEKALASINLGLPILYLYLGLGLCIGVGGSVISGQLIGKTDREKASGVFTQSIVTSLIITALLSVGVFLLFNPILRLLRAEGELSSFFKSYYSVMLFSYPLLVITTIFGMFIRTDERPEVFMGISLMECILNFVLDYV
ncbi:MAG: MATE family efflux transporter, partial [Candidatus Ornithospirochaeta sp.]